MPTGGGLRVETDHGGEAQTSSSSGALLPGIVEARSEVYVSETAAVGEDDTELDILANPVKGTSASPQHRVVRIGSVANISHSFSSRRLLSPSSQRGLSTQTGRHLVSGGEQNGEKACKSGSSPPQTVLDPVWLSFTDNEVELEYCRFAYVNSGFYGGKLWHFLAAAIVVVSFFYWYTIRHGFTPRMFIDEYWIAMTVSAVVTTAMFICCFVERLAAYREVLFLVSLFTHWPAFLISFFFGMGTPYKYNYAIITGCYFFCAFVVQARFSRVVWFLLVSPIITLIVATNSFPYGYWEYHSAYEIVYWPLVIFPVTLLRYFERTSRKSFLQMMTNEKKIHDIESKIGKTQQLIAKFFPKTPTLDLLTTGTGEVRHKVYQDTALVVTDLAGFTAWTSRTPPSVVISTLSQMFENIDSQLEDHFIEKVSTIGDAFIGASFPCSFLNTEQRCSITISFCCNILPYGGELQLRIGTHIGEVTGAFVGSAPPKFDIFGEDVEIAKVMEQDGVPGKVHITPKMLALAEAHGHPTEREQGKSGIVTVGWALQERCSTGDVSAEAVARIENQDTEGGYCGGEVASDVLSSPVDESLLNTPETQQVSTETGTSAGSVPMVALPTEDNRAKRAVDDSIGIAAAGQNKEFSAHDVFRISAALTSMGNSLKKAPMSMRLPLSHSSQHPGEAHLQDHPATSAVFGHRMNSQLGMSASGEASGSFYNSDPNCGTSHSQPSSPTHAAGGGGESTALRRSSVLSGHSFSIGKPNPSQLAPQFHPVYLRFAVPAHERMYKKYLARTNLTEFSVFVFIIMQLHLFLAHLLLGCFDSVLNRILTGLTLLVIIINIGLFRRGIRGLRYVAAISIASYGSITLMSALIDGSCDPKAPYYVTINFSQNSLMIFYVSQFILENNLPIRLALNVATIAFCYGLIGLRFGIHRDDALPWDPVYVIALLGLGFVSYFADFTLRSAFVAERKLQLVLKMTKGKHHETTKGALGVMLPGFVSDRLLGDENEEEEDRKKKEDEEADNYEDVETMSMSSRTSASFSIEGEEDDEDILGGSSGSAKLWEFHSVGVMFVYFNTHHQGSEEHHIEIINEAFSTIEGILKAANIHKIKTIGTAVMCVYGINDDESDPVNTVVCAAIEIRRRVLEKRVGWTYTFGIHLGPCTGAVMGTESLMFDIFGDSVNMASRMASTAPPKGIQLSPGAAVALSDDFKTEKRPPIQVKGKGQIEPIVVIE